VFMVYNQTPVLRKDCFQLGFHVGAAFVGADKGTRWATGDDPIAAVFYFFQVVDLDWLERLQYSNSIQNFSQLRFTHFLKPIGFK